MCLSIPGKIIEIKQDNKVVIDYVREKTIADNSLTNAKIGDYVIIKSKFVISTVDQDQAEKTIKEWKENDS